MIYERKHKIGVDEVNRNFLLTNRALITIFENTASFFSDSLNHGILDIPKTLLTWFVVDWKIEVIKRPKYGDEITIKNWNRDAYKCFSYMDFEVYINNELYVKATSKWVLFNLKTKSYEIISDEIINIYGCHNDLSTFNNKELEHMNTLEKYSNKKRIIIRKSDLDFNNHVNNVKYFDYLTDYFDSCEYDKLRITYRKEIKSDDIVYLCYKKLNSKDYYTIIDKDNNIKTIIECE